MDTVGAAVSLALVTIAAVVVLTSLPNYRPHSPFTSHAGLMFDTPSSVMSNFGIPAAGCLVMGFARVSRGDIWWWERLQ